MVVPGGGQPRVEALTEDDWADLRDLRLRALAESPDAFWATLADEQRHDDVRWRGFLRAAQWFAVRDRGRIIAAAAGLRRPADSDAPELIGMWVDPDARRRGLGELVVRRLVEWARDTGAASLDLEVVDGNTTARRLYERLGFVGTGVRSELPHRTGTYEERLRLALR